MDTLVSDREYEGKYVAIESFTNNRVVASGHNPEEVVRDAALNGVAEPVIVFIPYENMTYIY